MRGLVRLVAFGCLTTAASAHVFLSAAESKPCDGVRGVSIPDDPFLLDVAERWKDAYNAGDAERVASLYTPAGQYLSAHVHARGA